MKSFLTSALSLLIAAAFVFTPALVDGKTRVKKTVELAEGAALVLTVGDGISRCEEWFCHLTLREQGKKKDTVQIVVEGDGAWIAYSPEEEDKDKDKEGDDDDSAGDDDDSAGDDDDSAGDDDDSADWRNKPILTRSERVTRLFKKTMGKYTIEAGKGAVVTTDLGRTLTIPAEILPAGAFTVATTGYFGLSYDGVKIGSATQSGVIKVTR